MGGLRMGKPLNAAAGLNAADFANSIRTVFDPWLSIIKISKSTEVSGMRF
jgi:hypothetical protein